MSYTRLTVIGSRRKADVVLPGDQPVGTLVPQLLDLLEEGVRGGEAIALTTLTGVPVELGTSLDDQEIGHGELVRLTALDDAPQAPEVVDVTDAVADATARHRGQWRRPASISALAAAAAAAAWIATAVLLAIESSLLWWLLAGLVSLAVLAVAAARRERPGTAAASSAAAAGALVPWSTVAADRLAPPSVLAFPGGQALITAALLWLVVALVLGAGRGRRSAAVAAGIGMLSSAALLVAAALGAPPRGVTGVGAAIGMALLGLLPGLALSLSGLTGHDDRVIGGGRASRREIGEAILEAFDSLSWTTLAVAVPTAVLLASLVQSTDPWELGLAAAIAAVTALRARLLPLVVQRSVLLLVAALPLVVWLVTPTSLIGRQVQALAAAVLCLLAIGVASLRPSDLGAARLRRAADIAELLSVLAVVPVLLGALGVYADLYEVFG